MGSYRDHYRDRLEETSSAQASKQASQGIAESEAWIEVERSRELLAVAGALQDELIKLHAELALRYTPSIEEHIHRLSIERDEALVTWGRSILGLEALGVTTRLHFPDQSTPPARARGITPSWFNGDKPADDEGRLLGAPVLSNPSSLTTQLTPAAAVEEPQALTLATPPTPIAPPAPLVAEPLVAEPLVAEPLVAEPLVAEPLVAEPLSEDEELIDDDAVEDPGIAEAQHVLLTPSDLKDLQDKLSQQKVWSHQEPEELAPQAWQKDAEALALRIGPPRGQLEAAQTKQSLLDIEAEVECCQQWGDFDREVQNAILSLITSRLRKLQGHIGSNLFDQDRIAKLFRRLTRYSSDFRPGFVQALSRDKTPSNDSWDADEREAWKRLEGLLDITKPLPKLSDEQQTALTHLKEVSSQARADEGFSQEIREAVSKCLTAGFPSESPHLTEWVLPHLSHLSGRRFKSLRQAQSQLG